MSVVQRLTPAFQARLDGAILPRRAVFGFLDGENAAIAAANPGGTVSIHWSHAPDKPQIIRINRDITSLAIGRLDSAANDTLFIGTPTNLTGYDIVRNSDVLFKDVADGVNAIAVGAVSKNGTPLAVVGGNCSVQGFDYSGEEQFWTVTGDNVTSLALCDVDADGSQELIVGSEDCQIRAYRGEQIIWETSESDAILCLTAIQGNCFAYALTDGSIGVYEGNSRLWSLKLQVPAVAIASFDIDGDGTPEIILGLTDGTIEARLMKHGTLLYSDNIGATVAAILIGDYRQKGTMEVIVCAIDGAIQGYQGPDTESSEATPAIRSGSDDAAIAKMKSRIAELQRELNGYDSNLAAIQKSSIQLGSIPVDTKISCALGPNLTKTALELRMESSNDTLIKVVMIFADGVFESGSLLYFPDNPDKTVAVPLRLQRHVACQLMIKVVVGYKGVAQDHVFELSHRLPKFASFVYCKPRDMPQIGSVVTLPLKERISRVILWLSQSFLLDLANRHDNDTLNIGFKCMRNDVFLNMAVNTTGSSQFQVRTDDMQLAGDIIQDLCTFLSIDNCESVASFPKEFKDFEDVLKNMSEYADLRKRLCSEMVDLSNFMKTLVVKGEDARLLGDMAEMKIQYSELFDTNNELIGELNKRAANHEALLDALKQVNLMIQRAARLRTGAHKAAVIQACRNAIKSNATSALLTIIKLGHE